MKRINRFGIAQICLVMISGSIIGTTSSMALAAEQEAPAGQFMDEIKKGLSGISKYFWSPGGGFFGEPDKREQASQPPQPQPQQEGGGAPASAAKAMPEPKPTMRPEVKTQARPRLAQAGGGDRQIGAVSDRGTYMWVPARNSELARTSGLRLIPADRLSEMGETGADDGRWIYVPFDPKQLQSIDELPQRVLDTVAEGDWVSAGLRWIYVFDKQQTYAGLFGKQQRRQAKRQRAPVDEGRKVAGVSRVPHLQDESELLQDEDDAKEQTEQRPEPRKRATEQPDEGASDAGRRAAAALPFRDGGSDKTDEAEAEAEAKAPLARESAEDKRVAALDLPRTQPREPRQRPRAEGEGAASLADQTGARDRPETGQAKGQKSAHMVKGGRQLREGKPDGFWILEGTRWVYMPRDADVPEGAKSQAVRDIAELVKKAPKSGGWVQRDNEWVYIAPEGGEGRDKPAPDEAKAAKDQDDGKTVDEQKTVVKPANEAKSAETKTGNEKATETEQRVASATELPQNDSDRNGVSVTVKRTEVETEAVKRQTVEEAGVKQDETKQVVQAPDVEARPLKGIRVESGSPRRTRDMPPMGRAPQEEKAGSAASSEPPAGEAEWVREGNRWVRAAQDGASPKREAADREPRSEPAEEQGKAPGRRVMKNGVWVLESDEVREASRKLSGEAARAQRQVEARPSAGGEEALPGRWINQNGRWIRQGASGPIAATETSKAPKADKATGQLAPTMPKTAAEPKTKPAEPRAGSRLMSGKWVQRDGRWLYATAETQGGERQADAPAAANETRREKTAVQPSQGQPSQGQPSQGQPSQGGDLAEAGKWVSLQGRWVFLPGGEKMEDRKTLASGALGGLVRNAPTLGGWLHKGDRWVYVAPTNLQNTKQGDAAAPATSDEGAAEGEGAPAPEVAMDPDEEERRYPQLNIDVPRGDRAAAPVPLPGSEQPRAPQPRERPGMERPGMERPGMERPGMADTPTKPFAPRTAQQPSSMQPPQAPVDARPMPDRADAGKWVIVAKRWLFLPENQPGDYGYKSSVDSQADLIAVARSTPVDGGWVYRNKRWIYVAPVVASQQPSDRRGEGPRNKGPRGKAGLAETATPLDGLTPLRSDEPRPAPDARRPQVDEERPAGVKGIADSAEGEPAQRASSEELDERRRPAVSRSRQPRRGDGAARGSQPYPGYGAGRNDDNVMFYVPGPVVGTGTWYTAPARMLDEARKVVNPALAGQR